MGYAFRDQPFRTLSFSSASSPDAGLLDLFTTNDYSNSSGMRGGVVNLILARDLRLLLFLQTRSGEKIPPN